MQLLSSSWSAKSVQSQVEASAQTCAYYEYAVGQDKCLQMLAKVV